MFLLALTLHSLPHVRGYEFFGRGDQATYQGVLTSLIANGSLLPDNFYPAATLVAYQLVVFAGAPLAWVDVAGRILPMAAFLLGNIVLGRLVLGTRTWDSAIAVAALLPLAGAFAPDLSPSGFGVALTPIVIASLLPEVGRTSLGRRARAVLLPTFAFVHPLGCLVLLGVVLVAMLVLRLANNSTAADDRDPAQNLVTPAALLGVSFAAWITPTILFASQLTSFRDALLSGLQASPGAHALGLANQAGLDLLELVTLPILTNLGVVFASLLGTLAAVWAITVQRERWLGRRRRLALVLSVEGLLGFAFLASLIAPIHLDVFRFVHFFAIVAPCLLAITVAVLGRRRLALSAGVLVAVAVTSWPFLYASPWLRLPSDFVPREEIAGVLWLLEHNQGAQQIPVTYLQTLNRDVDLAVGYEVRRSRTELANPLRVPDHFGRSIDGAIHLGNDAPVILVITSADISTYTGVWSKADRFNAADFRSVEGDPGLSRLFVNDAVGVYLVPADHPTSSRDGAPAAPGGGP